MRSAYLLFLVLATGSVCAQSIRPIKDDVGFCWDRSQMERLVGYLSSADTADFYLHGLIVVL
jgi:hypothetical protein